LRAKKKETFMARWAARAGAAVIFSAITVLSAAVCGSTASAEVRITGDGGGQVTAYLRRFRAVRDSGERVIIDGPCMSACTLLLAMVPRDRICVTSRAVLGFHAASYYNDASHTLVPTRSGSRLVTKLYPPRIQAWIEQHGGLSPAMMRLEGRELTALYHSCQ
jgi:hypothetical protein